MRLLDAIAIQVTSILAGEVSEKCGGIVKNCVPQKHSPQGTRDSQRNRASARHQSGDQGGRVRPPLRGLLLLRSLLWRLGSGF